MECCSAVQSSAGWGGLVELGMRMRRKGGFVRSYFSLWSADRSSKPCTGLVYITAASGTTGGETTHVHVHIYLLTIALLRGCSTWFVVLWKSLSVSSALKCPTMLSSCASIFTALPNIYAMLIVPQYNISYYVVTA